MAMLKASTAKPSLDGNPDSATCSDCHGLHKIPILKGDEPKMVEFRKEFHTEVCQKCHADKEMMKTKQGLSHRHSDLLRKLPWKGRTSGLSDVGGGLCRLPWVSQHSASEVIRSLSSRKSGWSRPAASAIPGPMPISSSGSPMRPIKIHNESRCSTGTFVLMTALLIWVFGVFWFHTFLWWRKDFWEKRELRAKGVFFPLSM